MSLGPTVWEITCIHHTDAERAVKLSCPICTARERDEAVSKLADARLEIGALRAELEKQKAWQAEYESGEIDFKHPAVKAKIVEYRDTLAWALSMVSHDPSPDSIHASWFPDCEICKKMRKAKAMITPNE